MISDIIPCEYESRCIIHRIGDRTVLGVRFLLYFHVIFEELYVTDFKTFGLTFARDFQELTAPHSKKMRRTLADQVLHQTSCVSSVVVNKILMAGGLSTFLFLYQSQRILYDGNLGRGTSCYRSLELGLAESLSESSNKHS